MSMIKRQHTFTIDYYSDIEKKHFSGKFTSRIAGFVDKTKISVRMSQICGGMYCVRDEDGLPTGRGVDEVTEMNARMVAWLETCLVQIPDWFKLDDPENGIVDESLINKIFSEVYSHERRFRGDDGSTAQGANGSAQGSEGTGAAESAKTVAGNGPTQVVGKEVQAALDP